MGDNFRQTEDGGRVFFRIILPFILQEKKLSLPLKFVRKYGDELFDVVKLRVSNGYVWNIQLIKEKKSIFLAAGLDDFFQYYSICCGHFLVFKYKGMSDFSVCILDKTTCEIEYPFHQPQHANDKKENDKSAEILHSNHYPHSSKQLHNKKRRYKRASSSVDGKFQQEIFKRKDGIGRIPKFAKEPKIVKSTIFNRTLSRMPPGSKKVAELAMNSKPKNPSFLILVSKSFVLHGVMFVPSPFASRYMHSAHEQDGIKVEDSDGGEWIVHTKFIWRGGSLRLERGWDEFCSDNCLAEGDVCVFEILQMPCIVFRVSIFHMEERSTRKFDSQLKNPKMVSSSKERDFECEREAKRYKAQEVVYDITSNDDDSVSEDENSEAEQESQAFVAENFDEIVSKLSFKSKWVLNEARMYKPKGDAFMVVIRADKSRDLRKMDVPAAFAKKYKHRITGDIITVHISDEEQWQTKFDIRPMWGTSGGLLLTEGWSRFVFCNNLEMGAVCIFELMNSKSFMLKATTFRRDSE